MLFLERVGNVFEKNQAEDDVLVFARVHVALELFSGGPKGRLKAQSTAWTVGRFHFAGTRHTQSYSW